jgi:hypothetical protein
MIVPHDANLRRMERQDNEFKQFFGLSSEFLSCITVSAICFGSSIVTSVVQYPPDFEEKDRNARKGCQNYDEFYEPILLKIPHALL